MYEYEAANIMMQLLKAINYVFYMINFENLKNFYFSKKAHSNKIIHRDLKP
jgi:serine/threonine protein kinase